MSEPIHESIRENLTLSLFRYHGFPARRGGRTAVQYPRQPMHTAQTKQVIAYRMGEGWIATQRTR